MATLQPLPTVARDITGLTKLLEQPALTATIRGGADIVETSVRTITETRAHLTSIRHDMLDAYRVIDPHITHDAASATRAVQTGEGVVRLNIHIREVEPLEGVSSLDDAERAVAEMVTASGDARGVLQVGDDYYTGTLNLLEGAAYTDTHGGLRFVQVGQHGFGQSTFGASTTVVPGNAPVDVTAGRIGTLDLQSNASSIYGDWNDWAPSLSPNSPVDIAYGSRISELKSIMSRDGMLSFVQRPRSA